MHTYVYMDESMNTLTLFRLRGHISTPKAERTHNHKHTHTQTSHSSQLPHTQGPTEDPFHARERERLAKEVPKEQAKRFHGMIAQHASADEVLVRKDSSSAVLVGLVRKDISNVCVCALVQVVSLVRKDSSRIYVYVHLFLRNAGL